MSTPGPRYNGHGVRQIRTSDVPGRIPVPRPAPVEPQWTRALRSLLGDMPITTQSEAIRAAALRVGAMALTARGEDFTHQGMEVVVPEVGEGTPFPSVSEAGGFLTLARTALERKMGAIARALEKLETLESEGVTPDEAADG